MKYAHFAFIFVFYSDRILEALTNAQNNYTLLPRYANYNTEIPPIPGIPDPRKKYEGIFSFVWEPTEERARILYMGNLQEVETIPEKWHPTKYILPKLLTPSSEVRVLTNELVVYECESQCLDKFN